MLHYSLKRTLALILTMLFATGGIQAQVKTVLQGKVCDAENGSALPFVQVCFKGSASGTTTDLDGRFSLSNDKEQSIVEFRMMGYEPFELEVEVGKTKRGIRVNMTPSAKVLNEVTISSSRKKKKRYSRNNNPAVDLANNVIAHRDENRLLGRDQYRRNVYEKLTLALDDFHPDFKKDLFWKHLKFVQKYVDQTPFDATPILTISMRETMMIETYRRSPEQHRTLVTGYRMEGVDQAMDQEGFDESLSEMFTHVDIYDADIELMQNHFVGPLAPIGATTFYHYYITDTADVDGVRCVELSFAPANPESFGFTGHMYIALDSTYRVARYTMWLSSRVNLNFVRNLTVEQHFDQLEDGTYVPGRQDIYCRLYIHKKLRQLYAHRVTICNDYDLSEKAEPLPDSLFAPLVDHAILPEATKIRRWVWNSRRPIELTLKETMLDSLRFELARLPWFKVMKNVSEVIFTDYIPTNKDRDSSRVDIGPVFNIISFNNEEGWRLRLGGMTKASLSPHHFAEGYIAYGFGDRRLKYSASYTYTFDPKRRHAYESPRSGIQVLASYDMQTPGQTFGNFTRDNIFVSSYVPRKTQYVGTAAIRLQKEWPNHFSFESWLSFRNFEPAGALKYLRLTSNGETQTVDRFSEAEWKVNLRFSPSKTVNNRRSGNAQMLRLTHNAPSILLSHRLGYMQGGFPYQSTDLDAEKRIWLGAFGYVDAKLKAGIVWNRIPYIRLYFPDASASLWMTDGSFNTMQPMEFVMDHYISFFATYHLKGLILNHIPLVNRLHLREVVGFSMLYGGLTQKNNPTGSNPTGLFVLPQGVGMLDSRPFMEISVGIENIMRFIRIDYVWRLSYNEHLLPSERGMLRVGLRFTL